jgi:hypothetical protein
MSRNEDDGTLEPHLGALGESLLQPDVRESQALVELLATRLAQGCASETEWRSSWRAVR